MATAMVLAAGLGTRLRPITYELPKPMVPVLDRPVMAHTIDLLQQHGIDRIVANTHYFPETLRDYFKDEIEFIYEPDLLGTAGAVRNAKEFFGDEPFLVISGDALTDLDVTALLERHKAAGGVATLCVTEVTETSQYGVVLNDSDGRITGFQEKPHPDEALSNLANCGMYVFSPEIFDYYPEADFADFAEDIFPALLAHDVPFFVHKIDQYWNDVGSLEELKTGSFDALAGRLRLAAFAIQESSAEPIIGSGTSLNGAEIVEGPVWIGSEVTIGAGVRLHGPLIIGDGSEIGEGSSLKRAIVLPGAKLGPGSILIDGIFGHEGICAAMRPRSAHR